MSAIRTDKLGFLCNVIAGGTPSRSNSTYWGGGIPWVKISDMLQGHIRSTEESISQEGLENSAARLLPKGTLLISIFATIGRTAVLEIEAATNQAIVGLIPKRSDEVDVGYLRRHLEAQVLSLMRQGRGGAQLNINGAILKGLDIPLPPLDEQKRIAAVLEKADALRRQRHESLQLTEKLIQSVFIKMFGDPATNPKDQPLLELARFGIVQTGNTPPRSNKANYAETGLEWIKTDNIVEGQVMVTPSLERLSVVGAKVARVAPAGSLLVACIAGSEKSIGRAALTDRKVAFNQQINSITPHADTSPLFLYYLVKIARRQIQMAAAKGMKKMINKSTFEGLLFIAPEYDDQLRFERVAQLLIEQSKVCQDQLLHVETFFSSLQQRAFRGELNLNRLMLEAEVKPLASTPAPELVAHQGRYKRPGCFIAPQDIEAKMMALEDRLDSGPGDSIPWSEDFFKYRILSQVLLPPFSFDEVWEATIYHMKDADYDTVKETMFKYIKDGLLEQRFDEETKGIVFRPNA